MDRVCFIGNSFLGIVDSWFPLANNDALLVLGHVQLLVLLPAGKHGGHAEPPAEGGGLLGKDGADEQRHPRHLPSPLKCRCAVFSSRNYKPKYHRCILQSQPLRVQGRWGGLVWNKWWGEESKEKEQQMNHLRTLINHLVFFLHLQTKAVNDDA